MHNSKHQCHMQQAVHTNDQLTSPNCKTGAIQKSHLLTKNIEEFSGKGLEERTSRQKKKKDRMGNRTMQKNKRGETKVESNDSPEIPDRGGDIRRQRRKWRII